MDKDNIILKHQQLVVEPKRTSRISKPEVSAKNNLCKTYKINCEQSRKKPERSLS